MTPAAAAPDAATLPPAWIAELLEQLGLGLPEARGMHAVAAEAATAGGGPVGAFRFEPPWCGRVHGLGVSVQHVVAPLGGCRILWVDLALDAAPGAASIATRLRAAGFDAPGPPCAPTSSAEADELFREAAASRPLVADITARPGGALLLILAPPCADRHRQVP